MRDTISKLYWEVTPDGVGQFNDLFMQLYISMDNRLNVQLLNEMTETNLPFGTWANVLLDISGSKLVKYRVMEIFDTDALDWLEANYVFGEYDSGIKWIQRVFEETGLVIPRPVALGWISTQRPERAANSFAPVGMAHNDSRVSDEHRDSDS